MSTRSRRPRPPKGTPTPTNIFALVDWYRRGMASRVPPTALPHLRRCLAAGLITSEAGNLRPTAEGFRAIAEYEAKHPTSAENASRMGWQGAAVVKGHEADEARCERCYSRMGGMRTCPSCGYPDPLGPWNERAYEDD